MLACKRSAYINRYDTSGNMEFSNIFISETTFYQAKSYYNLHYNLKYVRYDIRKNFCDCGEKCDLHIFRNSVKLLFCDCRHDIDYFYYYIRRVAKINKTMYICYNGNICYSNMRIGESSMELEKKYGNIHYQPKNVEYKLYYITHIDEYNLYEYEYSHKKISYYPGYYRTDCKCENTGMCIQGLLKDI